MKVIVVANQKGGVGKTTLTCHLAVEALAIAAGKVFMVDVDDQGSLWDWWQARKEEQPALIRVRPEELAKCLQDLREAGAEYVFIDTPPNVSDVVREVIKHADLVVVPVIPGPHELRSVGRTVDLVDDAHKRMVFVINAAKKKTRLLNQTIVALSQHGTLSPTTLHHHVDYSESAFFGQVVREYAPDSKAAAEFADLWPYVSKQLERGARA